MKWLNIGFLKKHQKAWVELTKLYLYDSIQRNAIYQKLTFLVFPLKLSRLVNLSLFSTLGSKGVVKIQGELLKELYIKKGVKQEDLLSPVLLNLVLNIVIKAISTWPGWCYLSHIDSTPSFCGYVVISEKTVYALLEAFKEFEALQVDLEINKKKTKHKITIGKWKTRNILRGLGIVLKEYRNVCTLDNNISQEIIARITAGNRCYSSIKKIIQNWEKHELSK